MHVACRCLLLVLVLPQLLALSWCDNAAALRPLGILHREMCAWGRSSATSNRKLHLRGGSGDDVGQDAAAVGNQEENKTSELPKHVNMELGETEAAVREKKAIDETCDELHAKKEKAQTQLAKQKAALLLAAAKAGDTQSLQDVLVHGVDWLGVMDEDGMNALHLAAAGGHQDTINSLLEGDSSGSSLGARANDGSSALHLASYYGFDAAVELLLARGADVHAVDMEGSTALHNAAYKGNSDIVSLLIKAGANVNQQQTKDALTALHLAAMSGATEAVSRLLATGADKSLRSTDGKSAGDIAREHRQTRVQILLSGVGVEDIGKAELAARFVAASLVDKVRQMKTAKERGRGVGGHALSGVGRPCPSVVTWAPPHVTLTTQWGHIKKQTEKQDEHTGLLKGLSKEGAGGGGGHALGRGVGGKARKSKEEEAAPSKKKKSGRDATPTRTKKKSSLDSSLKASEKGFGAKKVWALGDDVPVPYGVRSYADFVDYKNVLKKYLDAHPDTQRSFTIILTGLGALLALGFVRVFEEVDSDWADKYFFSRLPPWVLKYGGWAWDPLSIFSAAKGVFFSKKS